MVDSAAANVVKLCNGNLDRLPAGIAGPVYDRERLTPGIVHIGLGNFHRAHQAWYLHRLMQMGEAQDWAIVGAGVRAYDMEMRAKLQSQDFLTTLVELNPKRTTAEIIGPMIDYLPIEDGNHALIQKMSDPLIRIVSLTVTEGGYYQTQTGDFDADHSDIRHDASDPANPRTAFGAMVAALKARRAANIPPFTALSCDNLQGNGGILRQAIIGLARMSDPDLADWIDRNGAFPNSMVDCIVPATTPEVIAKARSLGIEDAAPVTHETFRQWVIEDHFPTGRPPFEKVGVTLADNVHAYEAMKLRILNGGHQLLANAGEILGVPTIADCMADPDISGFFHKVQSDEILPYVDSVPETHPSAYLDLVEQRFANPKIRDLTRRVAFDGSSRHAGFLFPSLRDALTAGGSVSGLALAEALWARMCAGERHDGLLIEPNDPHWNRLQPVALAARNDPAAWLRQTGIYGDLAEETAFADAFNTHLSGIWADGTRAVLQRFNKS